MPLDAVALAQEASTVDAFERGALLALMDDVGFDVGSFLDVRAPSHVTVVGVDEQRIARTTRENALRYASELLPLKAAALAARGVAIDTEVLPSSAVRASSYHRELAQPIGGTTTLLALLRVREAPIAGFVLGRCGRGFRDAEVRALERALPSLAIARATYRARDRGAELEALTDREREVVRYLCLGYTNREIAAACGTSPNTVRNQLASVFVKLGASPRAEAVAIACAAL